MQTLLPSLRLTPVVFHLLRLRGRVNFRWAVRHQIGILGALGVIGVLAVGAIDLVGNIEQERLQHQADQMATLGSEIHKLAEAVMAVRQYELDFLRQPSDDAIKQRKAAADEATAHLQAIDAIVSAPGAALDQDFVHSTQVVASSLRAYFIEFNNVISMQQALGMDESAGLQGAFREPVRALEAQMAGIHDPSLENFILKIRAAEREAFLGHDTKTAADQMKALSADFDTALSKNQTLTQDDKAAIAKRVSAYQGAFSALMNARDLFADELHDLSDGYRSGRPLLAKLEAASDELLGATQERFAAARAATAVRLYGALGLVTLAVAVVAWLLARKLSHSITRLTAAMTALAGGDLTLAIPMLKRRDEIGDMARALASFQQNALYARDLEAAQVRDRENREARHRRREGLTHDFSGATQKIADTIVSQVSDMDAATSAISQAAESAKHRADVVAESARTANDNIGAAASAAGQISGAIDSISTQIASAVDIIQQAVQRAEQTNATMASLATTAENIGSVLTIIQKIAAQTSMLALNATIEAARAGDAGRGFAVVAGEVKTLAAQTTQATEDIAAHIAAIRGASGDAVQAIADIGGAIRSVDAIAGSISGAVEQQAAATREIARSANQAATGAKDVSAAIAGVTEAAADVRTATQSLEAVARTLSDQAARLQGDVGTFIAAVQAV